MPNIFDSLLDNGTDVNKPYKFYQRLLIMYVAALGYITCVQNTDSEKVTLITILGDDFTVRLPAARAGVWTCRNAS